MSKYTAEQMEERMANVERRLDNVEGNGKTLSGDSPDTSLDTTSISFPGGSGVYERDKSGDPRDIVPAFKPGDNPTPVVPAHWKEGDDLFVPTSMVNPVKAGPINYGAGTLLVRDFVDGGGEVRDMVFMSTQIRRIFPNPNGD